MTAGRAHPSDAVAPWAETVPDAPYPMTMAAFLDYPDDDGYRYELVEGVLVRMVGSRPAAGHITVRLQARLAVYVEDHGLGQVTRPDEPYDFENTGQKDTGLLPDIGFYKASREALVHPDEAYPFAPDVAVEVASSKQYRPGMRAKAARYLAGGTSLVWVVWPRRWQVDMWRPGADGPVTLGVDDLLDGGDVIPGFTYPIARLSA